MKPLTDSLSIQTQRTIMMLAIKAAEGNPTKRPTSPNLQDVTMMNKAVEEATMATSRRISPNLANPTPSTPNPPLILRKSSCPQPPVRDPPCSAPIPPEKEPEFSERERERAP